MSISKSKRIKVMLFFSGLRSGGAEQILYNYCKFLDRQNYNFIAVYQHEPLNTTKEKFEKLGIKTIRVCARGENPVKNIIDTFEIIRKYRPDVVHCNMNLANCFALVPAKMLKVKIRINHSHIAENGKSRTYQIMATVLKKLCMSFSNVQVACGKLAGEYMFGSSKFIILNNAIDLSQFTYTEPNFRTQLNLEDKKVIGHAGRFTEQKNHTRVLEIFDNYQKVNSDAVLLLAGEGERMAEIKDYARKLGILDKVHFCGMVPKMEKFYSSVDLMILPSLYEGLPVTVLETQAAGKPILVSDCIDPNVIVTKLVEMESLQSSNQTWAMHMERMLKNCHDDAALSEISNAGYNIKVEAKKLDKIYRGQQ